MSASGLRLTIADNRYPNDSKIIVVTKEKESLDSLLKTASEKFIIKAKKLYSAEGATIDDISVLRDNDVLFASGGEPFYKSAESKEASGDCKMNSIAVMGPGAVGKSALTLQFVQGLFVPDYDPTIEDAYRKTLNVEGEAIMLDILDTAGQEDYIALRSTWMRQRDGFILVFSVTDRATFDGLESFYEQLTVMHEDGVPPLVIVGNKCDLVEEREVTTEEGKKLATSWHAQYLECSAKTGKNVEVLFETLCREIKKHAPVKEQPKKSKWRCSIL